MRSYFDGMQPEYARTIESLSRAIYAVREDRRALLAVHGFPDEETMLDGIRAGQVSEHPGYDDYLGCLALKALQDDLRAELSELLSAASSNDAAA